MKPNDEKCHMVNNEYEASLYLDYPSVNQISVQAAKQDMIPIFAVTQRKNR